MGSDVTERTISGKAQETECEPGAPGVCDPAQTSKVAIFSRHIVLVVMKAESGPYWGKLLKAPGKPPHNVKADWSKYKDEDDEEAEMGEGQSATGPPPPRGAGCEGCPTTDGPPRVQIWDRPTLRPRAAPCPMLAGPAPSRADHGFDMSQLDDLAVRCALQSRRTRPCCCDSSRPLPGLASPFPAGRSCARASNAGGGSV